MPADKNRTMKPFQTDRKDPSLADRLRKPFEDFFRAEASSGILLMAAMVIALIIANSSLAGTFEMIWQTKLTIGYGSYGLSKPLVLWINDGLMAVFFFFVGLEIKRELMIGELNSLRRAALPLLAAFGGMVAPALIYTLVNLNSDGLSGWGIPMATDIAFSLGILMLLGSRVPLSLKIFLTALAIVDDMGAVLVIAIFYTSQLNLLSLLLGLGGVALLFAFNQLNVRNPLFYGLVAIIVWVAFLKSGVHATIAGVLVAIAIPSQTRINAREFSKRIKTYLGKFEEACSPGEQLWANQEQQEAVQTMALAAKHAESPMQRIEHKLQPWVSFFIMPVFALANAGIAFEPGFFQSLVQPISLGIILGLLFGKPIGILLLSWIGISFRIASLPEGVTWKQLTGVGFLAGIGFTMSIFINTLAFADPSHISIAKGGILVGSLFSALAGVFILRSSKKGH
jgi:NhaA family Na+:H+ antiporter